MRRGFTLIEILIVVMLTGMVTTLALAPVVMTMRQVVEIQNDWSDTEALSRALAFIGRDAEAAVRLANPALIIQDNNRLGVGDSDTLIIMTTTPTHQMMSAGSVVYKIEDGGIMGRFSGSNIIPGLYRWVLEGVLPRNVKPEELTIESQGGISDFLGNSSQQKKAVAQLVLPWATEFNVMIPQMDKPKNDWTKRYSGALPRGLYLSLTRQKQSNTYDFFTGRSAAEQKGETRESIIAFP